MLIFIGFWNLGNLKDTILWIISVGTLFVYRAISLKNTLDFFSSFKQIFKWTLLLEFIASFYSFSYWIELIIVLSLTICAILLSVSERDEKNKDVTGCLNTILVIVGIILFSYSLFLSVENSDNFFSLGSLKSFLLPLILTIFYVPFFYLLALYVSYEQLFANISAAFSEDSDKTKIKKDSILIGKFNLDKVMKIRRNFKKHKWYHSDDKRKYIKNISQE